MTVSCIWFLLTIATSDRILDVCRFTIEKGSGRAIMVEVRIDQGSNCVRSELTIAEVRISQGPN